MKNKKIEEALNLTVAEFWGTLDNHYDYYLDISCRLFTPSEYVEDEVMRDMLECSWFGNPISTIVKNGDEFKIEVDYGDDVKKYNTYTSDTKMKVVIGDICRCVRNNFSNLWINIYRDIEKDGYTSDPMYYYDLGDYMAKYARRYGVKCSFEDGEGRITPMKKYSKMITSLAHLANPYEAKD